MSKQAGCGGMRQGVVVGALALLGLSTLAIATTAETFFDIEMMVYDKPTAPPPLTDTGCYDYTLTDPHFMRPDSWEGSGGNGCGPWAYFVHNQFVPVPIGFLSPFQCVIDWSRLHPNGSGPYHLYVHIWGFKLPPNERWQPIQSTDGYGVSPTEQIGDVFGNGGQPQPLFITPQPFNNGHIVVQLDYLAGIVRPDGLPTDAVNLDLADNFADDIIPPDWSTRFPADDFQRGILGTGSNDPIYAMALCPTSDLLG